MPSESDKFNYMKSYVANVAFSILEVQGFGVWGYEAECDIRENFDTNECPNIFVSTKLHE